MFEINTIMERGVTTVSPETHIYVAMSLLVKEGLSGIPIVDDASCLVGFLSEKDVLEMLLSGKETEKTTVADYMVKEVKCFNYSDSAIDVCEYFMNHSVHILPILDDGKYVGIVRRSDIIYLILRVRGKIKERKRKA